MQKIYEFSTVDGQAALRIRESQPAAEVALYFYQGGQTLEFVLRKEEFEELCNLRYRLAFGEPVPDKPSLVSLPVHGDRVLAAVS